MISSIYLLMLLHVSLKLKSSVLEVLFQIIDSFNYKEVGIKVYNPENIYPYFFFLNISFRCIKETSQRFFYEHKTYVIIDSYKIGHE